MKDTYRIHITGAPRSGTTVMQALFATCFDIDGVTIEEARLWRKPARGEKILLTKYPGDEVLAPILLPLDPSLWFVFMLRDPRDVIVSKHGRDPEKYWSNLRVWWEAISIYHRMKGHPRFVVVRYEDMVVTPNAVQEYLLGRLPFLRKTATFSSYHENVSNSFQGSSQFHAATRGVRAVTPESVGAWRAHLPRIKAQIDTFGEITHELIALGYEADASWRSQLDGVASGTEYSLVPNQLTFQVRVHHCVRRWAASAGYLIQRYLSR